MEHNFVHAFIGGMLIGLGAVLLMLTNGRIAGISGIVNRAISSHSIAGLWRWGFILGLIVAPFVTSLWGFKLPESLPLDFFTLAISGLIVGIGTQIGSGCTSGHGICGIGRLSKRSIVATMTFMFSAMAVVTITRHVL
ncbi:YeeE/YedE family protein [Paraglaciecola aquimarina]|uniref:YeeE/YedE family protein n=1 Tax=Paraglaciecola aquimarina TaxID=1235557 RepID=A0ABU3SWP9_9ALTE|nr:YeeE/YedE family protein [Paraglaciecola aquimarina]MDU0354431.1 YeeE/YedE family protein [Paraglaciecola aquimarina]